VPRRSSRGSTLTAPRHALSLQSCHSASPIRLVFPAGLVAGDVRRVEPVAGHGGAGESKGVDKRAQRGAPLGLRVRKIVSTVKRDWLPPLVGLDQSRWGEGFNLDHREGPLVHVQSP
jgi:hypothetical protein